MRTFLALDLDDAILDGLDRVMRELDDPAAKIRWVQRANQHLTMLFLGEVPDETLSQVCDLAAAAAGQVEAFDYQVRGVQCVPPRGGLRMIWAGVLDPSGGLAALHGELAAALSGLGLHEEDRAFKPHITLARVKFAPDPGNIRRRAEPLRDTDFGARHAEELVVYGSKLTPGGPVYAPVSRAPLGC
ncbi:MAG TPA: RNA 2',3'-cyclic phosphodiesterase [Phycisphaerae bacterium]|nr:RNA 2',3'-cyclic phosphodiesterase [Phycisphaerae bacterium]